MKQYYKILHEGMKHYDMQYHLGLNEDVKPFNPKPECAGGLFFADKEHVLDYLKYSQGTKLAVVEVPEEEQIVKVDNKYKAHRIIIKEIKDLWTVENYDWILNYFKNKNTLFHCSCRSGALDFIKQLCKDDNTTNVPYDSLIDLDFAFCLACENGHLELAKLLLNLYGINIHSFNEGAFCGACEYGHLDVAQWLYDLGDVDIHASNDFVFYEAPETVLTWLKSLQKKEVELSV